MDLGFSVHVGPCDPNRTENAATEQFDVMCDRRTYVVIWDIGQFYIHSFTDGAVFILNMYCLHGNSHRREQYSKSPCSPPLDYGAEGRLLF